MFHTAWRFPLGHRVECIRDGRLVEAGVGVALGLIECISAWFSVQLNIKRHGCFGFFSRLGQKGGKHGSAAARSDKNILPVDYGSTVERHRLEYRIKS